MSPYLVLVGTQNLDVITIQDLTGSLGTTLGLGFHLTSTVPMIVATKCSNDVTDYCLLNSTPTVVLMLLPTCQLYDVSSWLAECLLSQLPNKWYMVQAALNVTWVDSCKC